jgi:hypothetical protein
MEVFYHAEEAPVFSCQCSVIGVWRAEGGERWRLERGKRKEESSESERGRSPMLSINTRHGKVMEGG